MALALPINQFNVNHVFFQDPVKNTIMNESSFIRTIYSNELCMLNGICLEFDLPITAVDKSFNKFKCTIDNKLGAMMVQTISQLERDILGKFAGEKKQPVFRVHEQLKNGMLKVLTINNTTTLLKTFVLKISGLWSNNTEYGLTYKFSQC
jgi:hypothetical protein